MKIEVIFARFKIKERRVKKLIAKVLANCLSDGLKPLSRYIYYKNYNLLRIFYGEWYD